MTDPTEEEAGCAEEDKTGSDCVCLWSYSGERSAENDCVDEGTEDMESWNCAEAEDYDTNGSCQDPFEMLGDVLGAVGAGLGAALVTTPPTPTPNRLLPAYTFSVRFGLSEGRHSDPPLST